MQKSALPVQGSAPVRLARFIATQVASQSHQRRDSPLHSDTVTDSELGVAVVTDQGRSRKNEIVEMNSNRRQRTDRRLPGGKVIEKVIAELMDLRSRAAGTTQHASSVVDK